MERKLLSTIWFLIGIILIFLLANNCQVATPTPKPPATPAQVVPTPVASVTPSTKSLQPEVIAQNLQVPWALAFAPDGRLFFTERPGKLRVFDNNTLVQDPVATFDVAATGEAGLLGLALDPDFSSNGYLYVYYSYWNGPGSIRNRVVRMQLVEGQAVEPMVLIDGIPGGFIHDGGRIKFGPDGKLYITTGDAADSQKAQDLQSLAGKILRINSDGSIPEDNPFAGLPIYTLGHRNPEGLDWQPGTGVLFETEHGAVGNDEVNIIEKGLNYGWPEVQGEQQSREFRNPILVLNPAVAPSGAAFFTGQGPWSGSFLFATLRGETLFRLVLGGPKMQDIVSQERLFAGQYGRLRDVVMGPDGYIYFCTNNTDGRGTPKQNDDKILRFRP